MSETLYVYLQEDPGLPSSSTVASASASAASASGPAVSPTAPELRVYLSELYGQLWDVCYLHRNLELDVRILYNTTAAASPSGKKGAASKGKGKGKGQGQQEVEGGGPGPITRGEALLKPELEVVFSRRDPETEQANSRRAALVGSLPCLLTPPMQLGWAGITCRACRARDDAINNRASRPWRASGWTST